MIHKRVVALVDKQEHSYACSLSDKANIGVFSDNRLKPASIPAKRSTKSDIWHNTMIVRFEADHLEEGQHGFVSVAYPTPASEKVPENIQKKSWQMVGKLIGYKDGFYFSRTFKGHTEIQPSEFRNQR